MLKQLVLKLLFTLIFLATFASITALNAVCVWSLWNLIVARVLHASYVAFVPTWFVVCVAIPISQGTGSLIIHLRSYPKVNLERGQ